MLIAYHNKPENKEAVIAAMRQHREADEIVKGQYWENGKDCAVGRRYKSSNHALAETVDGVPKALIYMFARIFQRLPAKEALLWPERFFKAVPVGVDLSRVVDHFMLWILTDEDGIRKNGAGCPYVIASINTVTALYKRRLIGDNLKMAVWRAIALRKPMYIRDQLQINVWRAIARLRTIAIWPTAADAVVTAIDDVVAVVIAADTGLCAAKEECYTRMADKLIEIIENAPMAVIN